MLSGVKTLLLDERVQIKPFQRCISLSFYDGVRLFRQLLCKHSSASSSSSFLTESITFALLTAGIFRTYLMVAFAHFERGSYCLQYSNLCLTLLLNLASLFGILPLLDVRSKAIISVRGRPLCVCVCVGWVIWVSLEEIVCYHTRFYFHKVVKQAPLRSM